MNYLAVDCSGSFMTVLLQYNGKEYFSYMQDAGMKHSVLLMPEIDRLLRESGAKLEETDAFGVVIGPGSFTGIRIAVATVKALAKSVNKPVIPVTAFDCMAYNNQEGALLTILDAKHGHNYVAGYTDGKTDIAPAYLSDEETVSLAQGRKVLSYTDLRGLNATVLSPLEGLKRAIAVKQKQTCLVNEIYPLYIRKSQAEENR